MIKKIFAALLSLTLVLGMAVTAGAVIYDGINYNILDNRNAEVGDNTNFERSSVTIPEQISSSTVGEIKFYMVTGIGNSAFQDCSGLTSIVLPTNLTSIGSSAFEGCSGLTSIEILSGVTSIGSSAFEGCSSLESITIPFLVKNIDSSTFEGCSKLTSITFMRSSTKLEKGAFSGCTSVTEIYLPEGAKLEEWKPNLEKAGLDLNKLTIFINDTPVFPEPEPEPTPDPGEETPSTPTEPSAPETTTPAASASESEDANAHTVQQLEAAERPDPQDVEANERYSFWMGVKADLRAAADGKTLRVHVPAAYTNMPASVMEQIRLLGKDITVDLRWSGERLLITPETAQRKTALKAFWTFEQLCGLYAQ